MYLFARNRSCAPDRVLDAMAYATDIAAQVKTITGLEIAVWQSVFGAPITSFGWTTTVHSHADMTTAQAKLAADPGYLETLESGAGLWEGPAEDALIDIIATAGDGGHGGDYASMITAQCAAGKVGEAMGWGVEIMNHVAKVTGRDGVFSRAMYGPWGQVGWISMANTIEEIDAATAAMNADADYLAKVDGAGGLFLPGSGEARLNRRIG